MACVCQERPGTHQEFGPYNRVQAQVNPAYSAYSAHSAHSTYIAVTAAATVAPTRASWASVGDGGFAAKRAFFAWVTDVGSGGRGGGSGGGGSAFQNRLNPLAADQIALAFYLYPYNQWVKQSLVKTAK
ncbi:uncharacterized protein LY79DRAFT_583725 [Colletotrichum navitas]|uniref:Uncharacterized protein n=1 Tax=Colletotrichum navitas TaxID=681940 RepID=A0AAD8PNJ2_9PEZI|nr:uncharacterized protein LY79DRAFT_583725 [Colletotrichum navitas]KAK1573302.1 hypothetical protein LY79DRAFT_583725 [Colletotrichum navitas]